MKTLFKDKALDDKYNELSSKIQVKLSSLVLHKMRLDNLMENEIPKDSLHVKEMVSTIKQELPELERYLLDNKG